MKRLTTLLPLLMLFALSGCATMSTQCNSTFWLGDILGKNGKVLEDTDFRINCDARP